MGASNVLILLGSPRKKGNSSLLAEHLARGAREAGAHVETLFLQDLEIGPCTGCDDAFEGLKSCLVFQDSYSRSLCVLLVGATLFALSPWHLKQISNI